MINCLAKRKDRVRENPYAHTSLNQVTFQHTRNNNFFSSLTYMYSLVLFWLPFECHIKSLGYLRYIR